MNANLQTMMNDCSAELSDIDTRIAKMSALDKGRTYYTKYALIRTCGTVEFVYRSIVADFFTRYSIPQIDKYLELKVLTSSMSATYDNMNKLLGSFDDNWERNFKNSVTSRPDGSKLKTSINSLVNNRHLFAHGKNPTATFSDIKQYYADATILIQLFDRAVI